MGRTRRLFVEYQHAVTSIFTQLAFGLICGSLARGETRPSSDIDMLVALRGSSPRELADFRRWYFEFHERHGFSPDSRYPGEVTELETLRAAVLRAGHSRPRRVVQNTVVYDGIVWSGMLCGSATAAFVGDRETYRRFAHRARRNCQTWARALAPKRPRDVPLDVVLGRIVTLRQSR